MPSVRLLMQWAPVFVHPLDRAQLESHLAAAPGEPRRIFKVVEDGAVVGHAELGQIGGVVGSGRRAAQQVAGEALQPCSKQYRPPSTCQLCHATHRYARWGGRRVKARTGSRFHRVQDAQPYRQRRCSGRTRLPVMKPAHRAMSSVDGLARAGRV